MWVFDGEQWIEEGSEQKSKPEQKPIPFGEFMPELQVIEIVQVPKQTPVPPFPLP